MSKSFESIHSNQKLSLFPIVCFAVNISSVGLEDSSSEEADKPKKPAVPPRKNLLAKTTNQPETNPRRTHVSLKDKPPNNAIYDPNNSALDATLCYDSDISNMQCKFFTN